MGVDPKSWNPFSGTHAIVVEYDDIIRSPMLEVMRANKTNERLAEILDINQIKYMYPYGIYEWYTHRKHRNPLKELDVGNHMEDEDLFNIMKTLISSSGSYTQRADKLEFVQAMAFVCKQQYNMDYFFYNEYDNKYVREDLKELFPTISFQLLTGDFKKAVEDVPLDTTWVLSDITKLETLQESKQLNLSNIMVAGNYRYNYDMKVSRDLRTDIIELRKKSAFKFQMFTASKLTELEKLHLSALLKD